MITLNLAYPEQLDIKFKVSKYPDGQKDLTIQNFLASPLTTLSFTDISESKVRIASRFNSLEDLGLILCATKALRRLGVEHIELYIPYLLGARADRQFIQGGTSYLVDVIAPILNEQNFKHVTVYDAHSDVPAACIKNLVVQDNCQLVSWAIKNIYGFKSDKYLVPQDIVLVSPDAGALKKVYKVADYLGFKGDIIVCSKHRDGQGKLTKTIVPLEAAKFFQNKKYIILDDICDGGRTFINIAEALKPLIGKEATISLVVSHGIFSQSFESLSQHIDQIFCSNSYRDVSDEEWMSTNKRLFVKQFNIFQTTT